MTALAGWRQEIRDAVVAYLVYAVVATVATASPCAGQAPRFREVVGTTVMIIVPHPDDDIIGVGGILAELQGRDNRLIVVFLTAGEKGTFDTSLTADQVRQIRMREAQAAYRVLGFPEAELRWLGYRDGELDFEPLLGIRRQLVALIREFRPGIAFALDPGKTYYRYHYRDHRSAALVAADAIGAALWPLEYPELGRAFLVPEVYYFYTAEPDFEIDVRDVYQRKLAALSEHRSQFPPALNRYQISGPPPSEADMEQLVTLLTGALTVERLRRR